MALERETQVPTSASARWLHENAAALAAFVVAILGLLVLFGRQVATGKLTAIGAMPPWWLSVPLAVTVIGLALISFVRGERSWRLISGAVCAIVAASFLGWFLVGFIVIAGVYLGLQLIG